jgi:hypothetical protein
MGLGGSGRDGVTGSGFRLWDYSGPAPARDAGRHTPEREPAPAMDRDWSRRSVCFGYALSLLVAAPLNARRRKLKRTVKTKALIAGGKLPHLP